ncbi:MAG: hypothetical protein WC254_07185 [Candidatus Woesearchaeota archaeon]|jgi:heme/copper-type cytochrome/quinol oxidase subunit 2
MKKIFALVIILILLLTVSACREKSTDSTGSTTENTEETSEETTEKDTTVTVEQPFVQTGEAQEEVTLTLTGAEPSTIVIDLGDLVTLSVYSERVKATQLSCEELHINQTILRGETVPVTVEAKKEGIFYFIDATTGEALFKFIIAGKTFEAPAETDTTVP